MTDTRLLIFDWEGTLMQPNQHLFSGVNEMLRTLHTHYWLAIATNRHYSSLQRLLQELEMTSLFSSIRCADQTRYKPDPMMLSEILQELGLKPEQAIMIGDSADDMRMAQTIAMPRIAAYPTSAKDMQQYQPLFIYQSTHELQTFLLPNT